MVTQHFNQASGKGRWGGGKRMFKEVRVVAGLNSEVLYSEAIMS